MLAVRTLDATLREADARLAKQLGSAAVGQPDHRSVSLVDLGGSVTASSSQDHLGNAEAVARSVLDAFSTLGEGDAVVMSDPYSGSAHVQDHWLVLPFYANGVPAALVLIQSHLADVGGQAFGNYYPYARDVWQEGVVTTPVRLARDGALDRDVLETLKLNSRAPVLIAHDIALMYEIGREVAGDLSAETVAADGLAQIEAARERTRELAASLTSEVRLEVAVHNCAGPDARVTLRIGSDRGACLVDLTESSEQVDPGFINSTLATTRSAIARAFIDYTGAPSNSGVLAALDIRTTSGSIVDCQPPLAVGWSPFEPGFVVGDLVRSALSREADAVAPQRVREPVRPPVRIDGCRAEGCRF
jgi:N-methylhydantoinase B